MYFFIIITHNFKNIYVYEWILIIQQIFKEKLKNLGG